MDLFFAIFNFYELLCLAFVKLEQLVAEFFCWLTAVLIVEFNHFLFQVFWQVLELLLLDLLIPNIDEI